MPAAKGPRFQVVPTAESHFSWLRTRMSVERTLMSSVRTAAALIGFGFTMFQVLQALNRAPGVAPPRHPGAPLYLGLALIAAGIVGLGISVWQYRSMIRYLWSEEFRTVAGLDELPWHTPTLGIALLLIAIGLFAFGAVLLRV